MRKIETLNPESITDPIEIADLVAEIAQLVSCDTTDPLSDKDQWVSDLQLRRLEGVVKNVNKPASWNWLSEICGRASMAVSEPSGKALLQLSQISAARRQGESTNWDFVQALIRKTTRTVSSVDPGPRRDRLQSLLEYHIGIINRTTGDYEGAAKQQEIAMTMAQKAGDVVGEAIAHLCMRVEMFNVAFKDNSNLYPLVDMINHAAEEVVQVCRGGSETEITWRYQNAPIHVLQAHIWGVYPLTSHRERFWTERVCELEEKYPERYRALESWFVALRAGVAYLNNNRVGALTLANRVETEMVNDARPEARVTARYVMAMLAADQHLQVIVDEGEHMHQMRERAGAILAGELLPQFQIRTEISAYIA